MDDVVKAARDAGATGVWANVLYLRPGTREHFLDHLARDWPACCRPTSACTRVSRAYLTKDVVEPVRRRVRDLAREHGVADRRSGTAATVQRGSGRSGTALL